MKVRFGDKFAVVYPLLLLTFYKIQAKCDDFEARLEESEEKVVELQKLADQARSVTLCPHCGE